MEGSKRRKCVLSWGKSSSASVKRRYFLLASHASRHGVRRGQPADPGRLVARRLTQGELLSASKDGVDSLGGFNLHRGKDVGVDVEGDPDVRVPESFGHDLRVNPLL
jgi:hypothetical protein